MPTTTVSNRQDHRADHSESRSRVPNSTENSLYCVDNSLAVFAVEYSAREQKTDGQAKKICEVYSK